MLLLVSTSLANTLDEYPLDEKRCMKQATVEMRKIVPPRNIGLCTLNAEYVKCMNSNHHF
ncbi:hypothetical protein [Prochlorococcus marinus]|uniref:hypothetical protein n=1 Tax=Prochlorococcus marinus TaxID=1219 RepID=UPI001267CDE6|nr:hypothetical protein [Prochlorococcus marinus]